MSLVQLLLGFGLLTLGKWLLSNDDSGGPSCSGPHCLLNDARPNACPVFRPRLEIRTASGFARRPDGDTSAQSGA